MPLALLFLLTILPHQITTAYQPLQLQAPVTAYIQFGHIYLDYAITRTTQADVLFCFVATYQNQTSEWQKQTDGSEVATFGLVDNSTSFYCVRLWNAGAGFGKDVGVKVMEPGSVWAADKRTSTSKQPNSMRLTQPPPSLGQTPSTATVQLQSQALTQTLIIKNFFTPKHLYHMYTCPAYNALTQSCPVRWKENYLHTFQHPEKRMNLLVQRIHNGGIYKKSNQVITNHVFYGGTLRGGKYYMFVAVLSYLGDQTQVLNMWGGFSYCSDHANRDMFCYATDGTAFDAVSLVAGAVYKDVASNINGTDDTEIVDSFYSDRYSQYYMYFIQYHRPYTTTNSQGDQTITKKIYAEYAFAANFQLVTTPQSILVTPSCLDKGYKHNFLMIFQSDVEVYGWWWGIVGRLWGVWVIFIFL